MSLLGILPVFGAGREECSAGAEQPASEGSKTLTLEFNDPCGVNIDIFRCTNLSCLQRYTSDKPSACFECKDRKNYLWLETGKRWICITKKDSVYLFQIEEDIFEAINTAKEEKIVLKPTFKDFFLIDETDESFYDQIYTARDYGICNFLGLSHKFLGDKQQDCSCIEVRLYTDIKEEFFSFYEKLENSYQKFIKKLEKDLLYDDFWAGELKKQTEKLLKIKENFTFAIDEIQRTLNAKKYKKIANFMSSFKRNIERFKRELEVDNLPWEPSTILPKISCLNQLLDEFFK